MQEGTVRQAADKGISVDAAVAAVLSEPNGISPQWQKEEQRMALKGLLLGGNGVFSLGDLAKPAVTHLTGLQNTTRRHILLIIFHVLVSWIDHVTDPKGFREHRVTNTRRLTQVFLRKVPKRRFCSSVRLKTRHVSEGSDAGPARALHTSV